MGDYPLSPFGRPKILARFVLVIGDVLKRLVAGDVPRRRRILGHVARFLGLPVGTLKAL